ncbi:MAG: transketolase [Candidatus Curtissbacteria bacterium]|nr:transketolase [Candidatus Curtissbacteria bacterium]
MPKKDSKYNRKLSYTPIGEIKRIKSRVKNPKHFCQILSDIFRINTLYMIERAGSGHVGTSFSSIDIATWLWLHQLKFPNEWQRNNFDIYFSSKGHDVPALYSILIGSERISFNFIHKLREVDGLPGHPDVNTPYIAANTGSLGMGVSKAMGMVKARRMDGKSGKVYVMCGDGELQEGAFWESLQPAVNGKFNEITVIVDHNKIQSDTWVRDVSDLGDLEGKLKAFGWEVERCSGHDFGQLKRVFDKFAKVKNKPQILIADTVKGKGVSFMEKVGEDGYYKFHSGAPAIEIYLSAQKEIAKRINLKLEKFGLKAIKFDTTDLPVRTVFEKPQRLVTAYGDELVKISRRNKNIIAMDADLVLDTGLIPFKNKFPQRYIECGIAEQHMASMAGGLALSGKLPVVHSFACFLSTRPNEQIYNNATENTKIIYVGSLAGLVPGGPGHSHQSVRDISTLGSIPNLTIIEPSCEQEARIAIRWAVEKNSGSTYIRLVSVPCQIPYSLRANYHLQKGRGVEILKGHDVAIISYGPVMLSEAYKAARSVVAQNLSVGVYNLPWLNEIDSNWLKKVVAKFPVIFTIDNHYLKMGQGDMIASAILKLKVRPEKLISLGLKEVPVCGQNLDVLKHHQLDSGSIAKLVKKVLDKNGKN